MAIDEGRKASLTKMRELLGKGLIRGRLVELVVLSEDMKFDDMAPMYFIDHRSGENRNGPESAVTGYVVDVKEDHFHIASGWDRATNRPLTGNGTSSHKVYGNSVREYRIL